MDPARVCHPGQYIIKACSKLYCDSGLILVQWVLQIWQQEQEAGGPVVSRLIKKKSEVDAGNKAARGPCDPLLQGGSTSLRFHSFPKSHHQLGLKSPLGDI